MVAETITLTGAEGRKHELPTGLFINNEFVPSKTGITVESISPTTGEKLADVSAAGQEDIDYAVQCAKKAFPAWRDTPGSARRKLLLKLADLVERDADEFASIEALDAGSLYAFGGQTHKGFTTEALRYFAGWADKIDGKSLNTAGGFGVTFREPIGVCGIIVPWNAPLLTTTAKFAPAVATGNVVIIKTAELSPLYGPKLAQLVLEAGFPPGVINIVTGLGHIAGQLLSEHMEVRKIAFTGSGVTGRKIMMAAAKSNLKKVTLELGGKGATIVFNDADLKNAIFWSTVGITSHNGQICIAGSRIFVQDEIFDAFVAGFTQAAQGGEAGVGDPTKKETMKGPMISSAQRDKVLNYIKSGKDDGAKLLFGGEKHDRSGHYIQNTAFVDVSGESKIWKEEIFGPVACISRFTTEEEVIKKANDTNYGLNNALFTNDITRAHRVSRLLESGQVTVNSWAALGVNLPFGGVKESGIGRDNGEEGLEAWTQTKLISFSAVPGH